MAILHRSHPGDTQAVGPESAEPASDGTGPAHANRPRNGRRTLILGGAAVVLLVAAYFILGAFIPRWWSQRIGSTVHGSFTTGTVMGLCIGFAFTLVPLFVLTLALRPKTHWKLRVGWLVLALILAAPNLCTLGVVAGDGSGAHAGQRTLDVNAPAFRGASLAGAIAAAALYLVLMYFILRRRPGRRAKPKADDVPRSA